MRIIFAGTPEFSCPTLTSLINHQDYEVCAVYTQPDRGKGRSQKITPSPIKVLAQSHAIPIEQPLHLKTEECAQRLKSYDADLMIVVAYGLILPQAILDIPKQGCLNIHASLLPFWRGAAPIQRALLAGDDTTGISIMKMTAGLDTGPILYTQSCPIESDDTAQTLHNKLAILGANALLTTLDDLANKLATMQRQNDEQATYASKLTKQDGLINWHAECQLICRQIRALRPWPATFSFLNDLMVKVHQARCIESYNHQAPPGTITHCSQLGLAVATGSNQDLLIEQCQLPNKPIMTPDAICCGHPDLLSIGNQFRDEAVI